MKIVAKHAIITDICRENHGDTEAVDMALKILRNEALAIMSMRKEERGITFHLMLSVENPGK